MTSNPKSRLADELALDEAQRIAKHEQVKKKVRGEVGQEVAESVDAQRGEGQAEVGGVARVLRHQAVAEVRETESDLVRAKKLARVVQFVDYAFYLIYGIVTLRIALELFGAREWSPFKQFVNVVTAPFLAPFRGLFPTPELGPFQLTLSFVFAIVVFVLVHWAARSLVRVLVHRQTNV